MLTLLSLESFEPSCISDFHSVEAGVSQYYLLTQDKEGKGSRRDIRYSK